jgi:hypothetical protein
MGYSAPARLTRLLRNLHMVFAPCSSFAHHCTLAIARRIVLSILMYYLMAYCGAAVAVELAPYSCGGVPATINGTAATLAR